MPGSGGRECLAASCASVSPPTRPLAACRRGAWRARRPTQRRSCKSCGRAAWSAAAAVAAPTPCARPPEEAQPTPPAGPRAPGTHPPRGQAGGDCAGQRMDDSTCSTGNSSALLNHRGGGPPAGLATSAGGCVGGRGRDLCPPWNAMGRMPCLAALLLIATAHQQQQRRRRQKRPVSQSAHFLCHSGSVYIPPPLHPHSLSRSLSLSLALLSDASLSHLITPWFLHRAAWRPGCLQHCSTRCRLEPSAPLLNFPCVMAATLLVWGRGSLCCVT